jgi:hypothetical protein
MKQCVLKISIIEDQSCRFTAKFKIASFQVTLDGSFVHFSPGGQRPGEADLGNPHMPCKKRSSVASTSNDVHDAGWKASFDEQFAPREYAQWRLLGILIYELQISNDQYWEWNVSKDGAWYRVASSQGGSHLQAHYMRRAIPGSNASTNTIRLVAHNLVQTIAFRRIALSSNLIRESGEFSTSQIV